MEGIMGREKRNTKAVVVAILLLGLAVFTAAAAASALKWSRLGRLQGTTGAQPFVAALAAHPTDPDVLYVGAWLTTPGAALIYRSADGGATWQPAAAGLPTDVDANTGVVDLLLDPTDPDVLYVALHRRGIWRSDDAGATWQNLSGEALAADEDVIALALDPGAPAALYALSADGLIVLGGDGRWTARNRGLPDPQTVVYNGLALDPTDPGTLYIATNPEGLYRTTNGGRVWRENNYQLGQGVRNVKGVAVSAGGDLFVSLRGVGLLRSADDGRTWTPSQEGITFTNTLFGTISAPVFDPNQPDVALTYNSDGVFRSADGGATWQRLSDGLSVMAVVTTLAFAPARPDVAYGGTAAGGVWMMAEQVTDPPRPPPPARLMFVPVIKK
jgi:photosystem II stability/assembly factor-like uncharacterized protein